jgi:hypothetical protein
VLPDGSKSLIPAAWTDLDGAAADTDATDQAGTATLGRWRTCSRRLR